MVYYNSARLDRVFQGLADPTRRAILTRLAEGDKTISELASRFDMSLPAVSKHVRVLERAGLARIEREGRSRRTILVGAPLREARDWIERYRRFWEFQFDRLEAFLDESDPSGAGGEARTSTTTEVEGTAWPRRRGPKGKRSKSGARSRRPRSASSTRGRAPKR